MFAFQTHVPTNLLLKNEMYDIDVRNDAKVQTICLVSLDHGAQNNAFT